MDKAAMGNARFFSRSGPHPLAVVAQAACGIVRELDLLIEGMAPLQTAGPNEVSFLDNRRYASALKRTLAGAVIAPWTLRNVAVHGRLVLIASEGGVTFWTGNHREAIGEGDLAANPHLTARNAGFRARHAGPRDEAPRLGGLAARAGAGAVGLELVRDAGGV